MNTAPAIETKVKASTVTAAAVGLVLWALGRYVFHGEVPTEVSIAALVLLPALGSLIAGYLAPHTHRPDLTQPPVG